MKWLIILCGHEFNPIWLSNIVTLDEYIRQLGIDVEYGGISNQDDFANYESVISFKFKMISAEPQLTKICDFITRHKAELCYDWFMKFRPDMKMLENFKLSNLLPTAINARARVYHGPRKIKHGMSVNGKGCWEHIVACHIAGHEHSIILDDMIYIFHRNIVDADVFTNLDTRLRCIPQQNEWVHTALFNSRKIPLNVIGINAQNLKHNAFPGDINMP
jgi:hypothetical protein